LIFGVIIGAILCANMIVMINMMYNSTDFKGNDIVGYAAMIVLFSLIFFGVTNNLEELFSSEKPLKQEPGLL